MSLLKNEQRTVHVLGKPRPSENIITDSYDFKESTTAGRALIVFGIVAFVTITAFMVINLVGVI